MFCNNSFFHNLLHLLHSIFFRNISVCKEAHKARKQTCYNTAYIYRDNELLRTVSLDDVKNPYTFRIEYGDGEYNDILVENGKIKISDASCPDS